MAQPARAWWRSAGVRFGFAYAILFGFSTIAVVSFVWWATAGELDRRTSANIDNEYNDLFRKYAEGGYGELLVEMHRRSDSHPAGDAVYLLADPSLTQVFGTLPRWPREVTTEGPMKRDLLLPDGTKVTVQLLHRTFPDGSHLLIGRDVHLQDELWSNMTDAIPSTVAIMAMLGVFGAVTVRRLFVSMLGDVAGTAGAISAGDLSSRVPMTGRGDEFDELAETINEMLDRISRLMDGVRGVSNAIAHDLRTPIARARARLEDAARDCTTEAELRAAVERAMADLDGVTGVFHALLRIAEIEAGARRSAFAAVDVAPLLRDLAELYEPAAEAGGQTLVLDVLPNLLTYGDRDMLQQAVANLLDNALKFSPSGTTVQVAAMRLPGQPLMVIVSDEGPGIPEADRKRAPERFFRGETARSAPGSGLGLALVQAVAVLHGGALRLEDNAPGLRAVITLPATAPPAPAQTRIEQAAREVGPPAAR